MRTQKSISNITYHRPEVFAKKVEELREGGVIGPCFWVAHKGESGDKDHIHVLLLEGCKVYNTDGLSSLFGIDIFPDGSKGSMTPLWKVTKDTTDWILYGIHNQEYLTLKNERKEHFYTFDDVKCVEEDKDLLRLSIIAAKERLDTLGDRVVVAVKRLFYSGKSLPEVLTSGIIPIGCIGNTIKVWEALEEMKASRSGFRPDPDEKENEK